MTSVPSTEQPTQRGGELVERLRSYVGDGTHSSHIHDPWKAKEDMLEAASSISTLEAERDEARRSSEHWRECFSVLSRAVVGETGLSAITVASELRARAESAEATVERLRKDAARLEWMMSRGARVVWHGKDSEFCSVWLPGTWDGDPERQVTGLHGEAPAAIDEARRTLLQEPSNG